MRRMFIAAIVLLLGAFSARAHFPFILLEADGSAAKVVFSDTLAPDTAVNIEKIANARFTIRDAQGKEISLTPKLESKRDEGFFTLSIPKGARMVYGVAEYGVLQVGDAKPFKLLYYPKAVIGSSSSKDATIGEKSPLEIVPVSVFGKLKFQVLSSGKPLPDVEVGVMPPDGKKKAVKTDKEGLTPEFEGNGRFGATAKWIEKKSGDFAGKKYDEVRNYATLVVDFGK